MFIQNLQKSFTGNWNRKMEPGNDSFGRVSGYSDTRRSIIWNGSSSKAVIHFPT